MKAQIDTGAWASKLAALLELDDAGEELPALQIQQASPMPTPTSKPRARCCDVIEEYELPECHTLNAGELPTLGDW